VAGSSAEDAGDPAAGARGAVPVRATGMSAAATRTPALVGAKVPFGDPWPAPGPPQPATAPAAVGDGSCAGSWGPGGTPAGAAPGNVVAAAGGVPAVAPAPSVAVVAGDGRDASVATVRLRPVCPAACAAVAPAGWQAPSSAGSIAAPPGATGPAPADATGAGAGAGVSAAVAAAVPGWAGSVVVFVSVVFWVDVWVVVSLMAVVAVVVVVVVVVVVGTVVLSVGPFVVPVAGKESVVVAGDEVVEPPLAVDEIVTVASPGDVSAARDVEVWSVVPGSLAAGAPDVAVSVCVAVADVSSAWAITSLATARPA
jgi:hypothetical protein